MQHITWHEQASAYFTSGKTVVHDGTIGLDVIDEGD